MKSLFAKTLVAALLAAPVSFALSLYDTAPPIGLPESHAVKYTLNLSAGYDDNLNSAKRNKKTGEYVRFGLGAKYADYESVYKLSYDAHVGGQFYNKTANGTDQRLFSDINLGFSLQRALGAGSSFSLHGRLSYRPEPDYSNHFSADRAQGDCLNWSLSGAYSQAIDSRWSWTLSASTNGNVYDKGTYRQDNREYLSVSASLNYKYDTRTSYMLSSSYRYDFREYGHNSNNVYLHLGINHSIDPVSSCHLSVGTQLKQVSGDSRFYPTLRGNYHRQMSEGFSINSYVSLDNENVNTYYRAGKHSYNYLSDVTWRLGADCSYKMGPYFRLTFGASLLDTRYSRGEGIPDIYRTTWALKGGLTYMYSEKLHFHLHYTYTHSRGTNYGYERNVASLGASYTF